jgi:hypothetical protein
MNRKHLHENLPQEINQRYCAPRRPRAPSSVRTRPQRIFDHHAPVARYTALPIAAAIPASPDLGDAARATLVANQRDVAGRAFTIAQPRADA